VKKRRILLFLLLALAVSICAYADGETVTIAGKTYPVDATEIDLAGTGVTANELFAALKQMPNIETVRLGSWAHTARDAARMLEEFPDVFFVMEMEIYEQHIIRTDMTAFSTLGKKPLLSKEHLIHFTFCRNLLALDLGHCALMDVSELSTLTQLKILILADTELTDISPLAELKNIEYL